MHSPDNIQYALETTRVLREPDRRIDTFGETRFSFQLISEVMDRVGQVRVRSGEMEAMRPRIMRPESYRDVKLDGFATEAREKFDHMLEKFREQGMDLAFLQYGFQFRRSNFQEQLINEPIADVRKQMLEEVRRSGDPTLAIIEGVDDAWEISLLKFSFEMIQQSHRINTFDFKRKGLI